MNRREAMIAEVPEGFFRDLLLKLIEAYATAPAATREIVPNGPEHTDLLPFARRAMIEDALRKIAADWGIDCPAIDSRGFWHHRRIANGRIFVTQNTATDETAPVRASDYKRRYSHGLFAADQLFPTDQIEAALGTEDVDDGQFIYALLTHGRHPGTSNQLGFAHFRFPKEGMDEYWPEVVDLFAMFPELVTTAPTAVTPPVEQTQMEVVEDTAMPELHAEDEVG